MTGFPVRNGRRRRVLNEEVLSASSSHIALRALRDERELPETPRYSEAAGVEHHPQITDFIPRRYRSMALLGAGGIATIAILAAFHAFALPIAPALGLPQTAPLDLNAPGSLGDWASAVIMLAASGVCWIIYFLRRHRIDDIRGRYRVWLMAALACLVASVDCVSGLHAVLASAMTYATGWAALRDGAAWWLGLAGIPALWIVARATFDAKECRLANALLLVGAGAYATALACYLGFITVADPRIASAILPVARLVGHVALALGLIAYARYVILDAQGLIPLRVPRPSGKSKADSKAHRSAAGRTTMSDGSPETVSNRSTHETEWIDGSRPEKVDYDADDDKQNGHRKLSKADRKRMRKLKEQQRAA